MSDLIVVPFNKSHLEATARLHFDEMKQDLATKLGFKVVRDVFHGGMLDYSGASGLVALFRGEVVGFVFIQADFLGYSAAQRKKVKRYFFSIIPGFLRRPWLFNEALSARKYLSMEAVFTNLGPLLVKKEFRGTFGDSKISLATHLSMLAFEEIKKQAPSYPVLTMIRPSNMPSIAAVAQGARLAGFKLVGKTPIYFGSDKRFVYKYNL